MKSLTPKQERFVAAYIETGNASEAYRRAYSAAKMSQQAIEVEGSRLLNNPKVTLRLAELRGKVAEQVALDRAWVLERLMRNARIALGEEKISIVVQPKGKASTIELKVTARDAAAANKALELLGKTPEVGLFDVDLSKKNAPPADHASNLNRQIDSARRVAWMLGKGLDAIEELKRAKGTVQ